MIKNSFKRILSLVLVLTLLGMSTCTLCSAGGKSHLKRSYSVSDLSEKKLVFSSDKVYYNFFWAYDNMLEYYGSSRDMCYGRHFYITDLIWVYNFLKENICPKDVTDRLLENLLICAEDSGIELH